MLFYIELIFTACSRFVIIWEVQEKTQMSSPSPIKDNVASTVETVAEVTFPGAVEAFQPVKALSWMEPRDTAIRTHTGDQRTENLRVVYRSTYTG